MKVRFLLCGYTIRIIQVSPSELFHNEDFLALKDSLGLVPTFSENWTPSIQVAYQGAVLDELRESERLFHQDSVLRALFKRNRNRKNGIDVFETPNNNLSIPFE